MDISDVEDSNLLGGADKSSSDDNDLFDPNNWGGKNVIICGFVLGPDLWFGVFTKFLIILPYGAFYIHVTPSMEANLAYTSMVLFFLSFYFLFRAGWTEPGIIPRMEKSELYLGGSLANRVCRRCNIRQPNRVKHCYHCDNCIQRFDHHCPWVNQCVGERNYKYFVGFVWTTTLLAYFVAYQTGVFWHRMHRQRKTLPAPLKPIISWMIPVITLYCALIGFCLMNLGLYHFYLIGRGQTTYEHMRRIHDTISEKGCFSRWFSNMRRFITYVARPPTESLIKFNKNKQTCYVDKSSSKYSSPYSYGKKPLTKPAWGFCCIQPVAYDFI